MTDHRDIDIMARTIFGEARGESDEGRLAVAYVILNRAKLYKKAIGEACLLSIHFSCWNNGRDNDSNQLAMMMADEGMPSFAKCKIAALQAAHGLKPDPTGGATHYHTHAVSPSWAKDKEYVSIGHHRFYLNVD